MRKTELLKIIYSRNGGLKPPYYDIYIEEVLVDSTCNLDKYSFLCVIGALFPNKSNEDLMKWLS